VKAITLGVFLALAIGVAACGDKSDSRGDVAEKSASAGKKEEARLDANDPNVVKISVPTIQCEMCAKTIRKGIDGVPSAEAVNVDVEAKTVFVKVANNNPETQQQLEKAIAQAGYSTPTTQRDPAAYEQLPDCCKEGGME
jgi:copper chaperone CopZ